MSYTNLLTIAMPCYERKDYFIAALESALNQTVKCPVIVVDNCSSHDYFEKVSKEKGVTYFRNERNIGLFPNQNRCYSLAKTEYVKVLDDDDLLSPVYVESFLKAKELHPDIDVFFSDYVLLASGRELSHPFTLPFGYMENGFKVVEYGIKYRLGFPYMTSAIKKVKAQLDLDVNDCLGGYDWVWVYSNADQLSFYGDPGKFHQYRIHDDKASPKYWQVNLLTVPYIYEKILLEKISDPKLKKKVSRNVCMELIRLKSSSSKKILKEIINSDNRFGKYLNEKLNENVLLKTIYMVPRKLVRLFFKLFMLTEVF
ncbi:MAG TPA: hypothetical protein DHV28_05995 [Ignavibacteriales bacterium]|nr:hypothetical protein [Ignavibacteriales bacterium]